MELEEIIELSLEGVTLSTSDVDYYSQYVQKFGKMMGVSLADMENLSYFFFSEIEKRKILKKKIGSGLKGQKKLGGGSSRELKR